MIAISSIDLFNALKEKVGEKEAKMLTEYMDYKVADTVDKVKSQVATKEDLLKLELSTKDSISKLEIKIGDYKSDTIKWMFAFFIPFYAGLDCIFNQIFPVTIHSQSQGNIDG